MTIKNKLLWVWQFPQNTIGFILTRFDKVTTQVTMNDKDIITVHYASNVFNCGVSLGDYVILDYVKYFGKHFPITYNHEHGHQKQSLMLGPLYLIVVGLTSAIFNNLWDRIAHKKWSASKRYLWYYNRFPERWADKLGGVSR